MAYLDETGLAELWGLINKQGISNEYVWEKRGLTGSYTLTQNGGQWSEVVYTYYTDISVSTSLEVTLSGQASAPLNNIPDGCFIYYNGKLVQVQGEVGSSKLFHYVTPVLVEGVVGYVNSSSPYPPEAEEGFTYKAIGKLGDKVGLATGEYEGTGTYGQNSPNSLTFDFEPKIVFITSTDVGTTMFIKGCNHALTWKTTSAAGGYVAVEFSGNSVAWYVDGSSVWSGGERSGGGGNTASEQLNSSGRVYHYAAIG